MKKLIFTIGLLTAIITLWNCDYVLHDGELVIPLSKLHSKEFTSSALLNNPIGNTAMRKMQVYTPPGYHHNRDQGYPVVYLLHSLPFSEKAYTDQEEWDEWIDPNGMFTTYPDFPQEGFRLWIDNLILAGTIDPMIIVMPNAETLPYGFSFYSNSALNGNFEDYIVNDLVDYIDNRFNTIANRDGRAIIGNSQGGHAAFKFGMKHPDIFGVVASHAGMIVIETVLSVGQDVVAENPNGFMGPDPAKFLTSAGYAMSAAWSPNLNNPPFFVDLPFDYPSGDVIPAIADLWYENDPFSMLDTYADNFRSLKGIYFDCGNFDELESCEGNDYMKQKLDAFGIEYTYETFDGGHFDKMFSRLAISLQFCSDKINM